MRWSSVCRVLLLSGIAACFAASSARAGERFTFHHEHVLGTSLEIQVEATTAEAASRAEGRVLAEIDRLKKVFSSYDAESEFSRWQTQVGKPQQVAAELHQVLRDCERWHKLSGGAFNPAAEAVHNVWKQAAKSGRLPERSELVAVVKQVNQKHWELTTDGQATPLTGCALSLNAIAKGAIIDWAAASAMKGEQDIAGVVVNIGGDLLVKGDSVRKVEISNPRSDAENAAPLTTIFVAGRGVATSGNYRRGYKVGEKWYSHVVDPRSGQPADDLISATVVASTAADADALATIFSVLTVKESQALAASLGDVDYLLVLQSGEEVRSAGWKELEQPQLFRYVAVINQEAKEADAKASDEKGELLSLVVNFELNRPEGGRYRRPYVAVWLEDQDEFPVRTALLFMQTKDPGPRWHRDLLRWYRNDGIRKLADGNDLIGTVSAATRGPGEYKAVFDGKDDNGKPLKPGKYTLFIEVAREHGTYQLIRQPVTLGDKPFEAIKLKSNVEVKSATAEYRAHQTEPAADPAGK